MCRNLRRSDGLVDVLLAEVQDHVHDAVGIVPVQNPQPALNDPFQSVHRYVLHLHTPKEKPSVGLGDIPLSSDLSETFPQAAAYGFVKLGEGLRLACPIRQSAKVFRGGRSHETETPAQISDLGLGITKHTLADESVDRPAALAVLGLLTPRNALRYDRQLDASPGSA